MPLQLLIDDPWLEPYGADIEDRLKRFRTREVGIKESWGSLRSFANVHDVRGLHYDSTKHGWIYREWAPRAHMLSLIGDFNGWDAQANPLKKNDQGVWECVIPDGGDGPVLKHGDAFKVQITGANGVHDRIPSCARYLTQDEESKDFVARVWSPEEPFAWGDQGFEVKALGDPRIYECHVGMAQEKEGVGTYREFAEVVLPRAKRLGYNFIQLMAVAEHPYYGSFGYHVSNFFAPSSRFGTPDDLKFLINEAHKLGIGVLMDVVHSHAVKNLAEGLGFFDGEEGLYFHAGDKGYHNQWDSYLFDYGKEEVLRFLLSNLRYWLEEFHFDGFRFDGVTSLMYQHHGDFMTFDHYDKYFKEGVDWDAMTYLQLANTLIQEVKPGAVSVAEDMSGMPGLGREIEEGGLGFDYRLQMGIPDFWIKLLKHSRDEDWSIHEIWDVLSNRRWKEKSISYCESHDQALVGDKTIAFWLMDQEMYWHMRVTDESHIIDRGIALHKMIRLITLALGGEGYLTFFGNEFGHPEWVDFPREGNGWSYKYARRQWPLAGNPELRYKFLEAFEAAILKLADETGVLGANPAAQLNMDAGNKVIVCERNNLILLFNFHPELSIPDYRFKAHQAGTYRVVLSSDDSEFGGHERVDKSIDCATNEENELSVYATNRTALVLQRVDAT
ncbi:MAG: alpha amylase C-terminal domain-containing protein [Verrucomicrobiota bacterium]